MLDGTSVTLFPFMSTIAVVFHCVKYYKCHLNSLPSPRGA